MNKRSLLLSALLAGGILASAGLTANALPVAAPQHVIVNAEAAPPPMVEQAYWGWHRRHYWHRPYWHRPYWHRWHHWRRW